MPVAAGRVPSSRPRQTSRSVTGRTSSANRSRSPAPARWLGALQHETDHLNGIVMEDHLTAVERRDLRHQHKKVASLYPNDWPT